MIQVLHIAAECYPAAKTGGLADVVGSLPKYFTKAGMLSAAIIPKYDLKWIRGREWTTVYQGSLWMDWQQINFRVQQETGNTQGYPLFVVDIPGLYDRPGIYNDPDGRPYGDEIQRYIAFQQAVLEWLLSFPWHERPRVLHCHDHHTSLIPWMVKYCPAYQQLAPIPTVFTIHNGQYQGMFSWSSSHYLPPYEGGAKWLLDWNGVVNPMAAAIKTAWAVTTVSESYLYELHQSSLGLESLLRQEWRKEAGIVNGIDAQVWDPKTDPMIVQPLEGGDIQGFKMRNKAALCEWFGFPMDLPLVSFIGRIVSEKGADLLPDVIKRFIHNGGRACFLILGTGEAWTQNEFRRMAYDYGGRFNAVIDYNESLSHQIYAGSDYLIMPSRVEPCGLNQMYAMRYGTIPIVRSVGGLKDTVPDIAEPDGSGRGIRFDQFSIEDAYHALYRAASMYNNEPETIAWLRAKIMAVDFSWEHTLEQYLVVYRRIGAQVGIEKPEKKKQAKPEQPTEMAQPLAADSPQVPAASPIIKIPTKIKAAAGPKPVEKAPSLKKSVSKTASPKKSVAEPKPVVKAPSLKKSASEPKPVEKTSVPAKALLKPKAAAKTPQNSKKVKK